MSDYFLGLISGTSVDGVDACLARFDEGRCRIRLARTTPYPEPLQRRIRALIETPQASLQELGTTDVAIGRFFAACALELIEQARLEPRDVAAIGHHGQTVYHHPSGPEPFSMQLGDPNTIAALTGITTAADFRGLDIACGGQGAPLVPAFHEWLFRDGAESRVVLNIGGIANLTVLAPGEATQGFDTGPGNTLLDIAVRRARGLAFDERGAWAAGGQVDARLLERFLREPYFSTPPPKSTGRELFNAGWLDERVDASEAAIGGRDLQATLAELTAVSISNAIGELPQTVDRVIVCGGGVHNDDLMQRLRRLNACPVESSAAHGLSPDSVEAAAFAWLAAARLQMRPGNLPTVTGARHAAVLGGLYCGVETVTPPRRLRETRGYAEPKTP